MKRDKLDNILYTEFDINRQKVHRTDIDNT